MSTLHHIANRTKKQWSQAAVSLVAVTPLYINMVGVEAGITPIAVLAPGTGKTRQARLWTYKKNLVAQAARTQACRPHRC